MRSKRASRWPSTDRRKRDAVHAQVAAARERLLGELARFLLCLDGGADLNGTWYRHMTRDSGTAERLRQTQERLGGGWPEWPEHIRSQAAEFVQGLTPKHRAARLLGAELDAALSDPRWRAAVT